MFLLLLVSFITSLSSQHVLSADERLHRLLQADHHTDDSSDKLCVDGYSINVREQEDLLARDAYSLVGCVIDSIPRVIADIKDMWLDGLLTTNSQVRNTSSDEFWSWVRAFYFKMRKANGKISSCSLVLPDSGQGVTVAAKTCHNVGKGDLAVFSNLNPDIHKRALVESELRGTDLCDPFNQSAAKFCLKYRLDVNWSTPFQTVSADYDRREDSWYSALLHIDRGTGYVQFIPYFMNQINSDVGFGAGVVLYDAHTNQKKAVVQCAMLQPPLSEYFRRLAGRYSRIYTYFRGNEFLTAASHAQVGFRTNPINCTENLTEGIARSLKQYVHKSEFAHSSFPLVDTAKWESRYAEVKFYVLYYPQLDWVMVVSLVPTCYPGRYLTANDIMENGFNCSKRCPPGTFADWNQFGNLCHNCPPGSSSRLEGQSVCPTCPAGTYQTSEGQTSCTECPENTESFPGAKSLLDCFCKEGYFSLEVGVACTACPEGAVCEGNTELPYAKEKYFAITNRTGEYFRCVAGYTMNSCLGGSVTEVNVCHEGYIGDSCLLCAPGYHRFGRECRPCDSSNGSFAATEAKLAFYFCGLLVVFYLLRRVVNSKYKALYIFLSFLQVFGLQSSFRVTWTDDIKVLMRYVQVANLQVDMLIPSCAKEVEFPWKFLFYLLLPFLFFLVDLVLALIGKCIGKWRKQNDENVDPAHSDGMIWRMEHLSEEIYHDLKRPPQKFWGDFGAMFVVNMRLMYLSICGRTFDMLTCTPLIDGTSRLSKDPNVVCWTGLHLKFMPLVVISLVFYVVGTPLIYLNVLLSGKRNGALYTTPHLGRWRTLYGRFKHDRFYWELIIIIRRLCVVSVKTFLNKRSAQYQASGYIGNFQAGLTCAVMFYFSLLHSRFEPFVDNWLNMGELIYLSCTFSSALLGVCFSAAQTDGEIQALERLFFFNFYFAVFVTSVLLWRDLELNHQWVSTLRRRITNPLVSFFIGRLAFELPNAPPAKTSEVVDDASKGSKDECANEPHVTRDIGERVSDESHHAPEVVIGAAAKQIESREDEQRKEVNV